jgi:enoyl-CoA hydratase
MDTARQSLSIDTSTPPIATLQLLGPGRGNAMGPDFWRELPGAVAAIDAAPEMRAMIVRGSGGQFSYGLDLQAMATEIGALLNDGARGRSAIPPMAERMHRGFAALAASRLPVIAAIEGWCIGAGIEMIAACDIRIATRNAKFALREVKVGIVPDLGGISRLPQIIGEGRARELALTGDDIDAETALRIGLVTHVVDDGEALTRESQRLAARLAGNPPLVVAAIKQTMNARIDAEVARINRDAAIQNGLLMQSEDFAEAMRAFMERRDPQYKGR